MSQYTMTIDGKAVLAEDGVDVINPATGEVFAQAPSCTRKQLDAAMESAQAAFRSWSRDEAARRKALLACADALRAAAPEAGRLLTQEQGKPLAKAIEEIFGASVWFKFTAGLAIPCRGGAGRREARASRCAAARSASSARSRRGTTP